ncbi:MAG: hypothetical protein K2N69_09030, partial [Helicobacter sp.]|nr:hypothetical protein [Helicobacter sp.]
GTQGKANDDGTINDTQNIVVNTNSATLNINGAGGVDKFDIEASSFTKTLTIAGNLGTVPNYEEANNNYDTVRIDLSKTSGVNLDISRLLVSNPNDDGIQIVASKGADNITLVAGANHDVIEFSTGGGAIGAEEQYTVDLANLRLAAGQSFTIDGLTITNVGGFANAASPAGSATASILTAEEIADILQVYLSTGKATANGSVGVVSGTSIAKFVRFDGELESLSTKNGWLNASGNASVTASGATLTFANANKANVVDLNFTFSGNDRTNGFAGEANKAQAFVAGTSGAPAVASGTGDYTLINDFSTAKTSATFAVTINGETYNATIKYTGGATANTKATLSGDGLADLIKGNTVTNYSLELSGASSITIPANIDIAATAGGKFTISGLESGDSVAIAIGSDSIIAEYVDATPAVQGQLTIDFGEGLLAGQSYTYLNKTVLATKNLTGEEVAEAFAFGAENNSGVDGAVVLGKWQLMSAGGAQTGSTAGIDPTQLLFDISGSSLILMEQTPGSAVGLKIDSFASLIPTLTGTGTLAVRTDKVTGTTTVQGEKSGAIAADSYVTFTGIGTGSAASGADAGTVSAIKANTSMLDTITNFDVSNDKLSLKDVNGGALTFASGGSITSPTNIYVDTLGSTLNTDVTNGIVGFGVTAGSGATTGADAITLDQKLYVVVNNITSDAAVGFEHGGDTYVIVGGDASGAATDDLVIKLAGVTGVTDITSILA